MEHAKCNRCTKRVWWKVMKTLSNIAKGRSHWQPPGWAYFNWIETMEHAFTLRQEKHLSRRARSCLRARRSSRWQCCRARLHRRLDWTLSIVRNITVERTRIASWIACVRPRAIPASAQAFRRCWLKSVFCRWRAMTRAYRPMTPLQLRVVSEALRNSLTTVPGAVLES